jgi:protein TonB
MKERGALLRWPLGGFLVASALAHAALFGLPLDLASGRPNVEGPLVVTLLPGPATTGRESRRQPPVPAPKPVVNRPEARSQAVIPELAPKPVPEPKPKPPSRPAPEPEVQRRPSPVAGEAAPLPAASTASPLPAAAVPPAEVRETEVVTVEADSTPQPATGSAVIDPAETPPPADFGAANGPRILQLEQPVYPARALRLHREGEVLLRLEIDSSGSLQSATIVQSAGYGFDAAALAAVRRAQFAPASRSGQPVSCVALLPVSFTLATRP